MGVLVVAAVAALLAVFGLAYLAMAVAAAAAAPVPFLVAALVSYAAGAAVDRFRPGVGDWVRQRLLSWHGSQFLVRDLLVLVLAVRLGLPVGALAWLLSSYVAFHLFRSVVVAVWASAQLRRNGLVAWRNLDVPGHRSATPPPRWVTDHSRVLLLHLDLLPLAGVAVVAAGGPVAVLAVLAAVAIVAALVPPLLVVADRLRLVLRTGDAQQLAAVRRAVAAREPRVIAYLSTAVGTEWVLNVWLPTYERLSVPVVVILREGVHLPRLRTDRLPIVVLPRSVDVDAFHLPTVKVALYSTNTVKNNHLVRLPGMKDVFVGHGDSDKGSSFNPVSRMYDEIWVAGPAGRERYHRADVGVRDDQIREVGRPQLAEVRKADPAAAGRGPRTVLYAPTWEGGDATLEYSSVLTMGEEIAAGLLALDPPVRVLYKPHPSTGRKRPEYAAASARISARLAAAPGDHETVSAAAGLYDAFNAADLMVTDVSSVISDFLYSEKPYVVTNPGGEDEDEYRTAFPSTAGAHLLGPGAVGLAGIVADAFGPDVLAARRREVTAYLLGDVHGDPIAGFDRAVTDLAARQEAEDAETGYAPGWYDAEPNGTPNGTRPAGSDDTDDTDDTDDAARAPALDDPDVADRPG